MSKIEEERADKEIRIGSSFTYKGFRLRNRGYEDEDGTISNWFYIVGYNTEITAQEFTYDDTGVKKYFKEWVNNFLKKT